MGGGVEPPSSALQGKNSTMKKIRLNKKSFMKKTMSYTCRCSAQTELSHEVVPRQRNTGDGREKNPIKKHPKSCASFRSGEPLRSIPHPTWHADHKHI